MRPHPRPLLTSTVLSLIASTFSIGCSHQDRATDAGSERLPTVQLAMSLLGLPGCTRVTDGEVWYVWNTSQFVVCKGQTGTWSPVTAPNGYNAAFLVTPLAPASICSNGGITLQFGLDANRNGRLDPNEISSANDVCNGTNGTQGPMGPAGTTTLMLMTPEVAGPQCLNGGVRIQAGADLNSDGVLSSDEVAQTQYVCNGLGGPATGAGGGAGTGGEGGTTASGGVGGVTGGTSSTTANLCDLQCPSDQKMCFAYCTSKMNPEYGCGSASCKRCSLPNALATCSPTGACAIGSCAPGFADCDGDPNNGCEADLTSTSSCAACGRQCAIGEYCSATGCVSTCVPPLTLCGNRCVNLVDNPRNCGTCDRTCPSAGRGYAACSAGTCSGVTCLPGSTNCGGTCVDTRFDRDNCGSCGNACLRGRISEGFPEGYALGDNCVAGACASPCPLGLTLCGSQCTLLETDAANCGTCGNTCSAGQNCSNGTCQDPTWLVTGLSAPKDIAVDANNVYWNNLDSIFFAPKQGGTATPLATGQASPRRIALDASHVYWTNNLGGAVMRVRKDGSGAPELVSAANQPTAVVTVGDLVVWVNTGDQTIRKAPKTGDLGGGTILTAAVRPSDELVTHGSNVFSMPLVNNSLPNGTHNPVSILEPVSGSLVGTIDGWFGRSMCTTSSHLFRLAYERTTYVTVDWTDLSSGGNGTYVLHSAIPSMMAARECSAYLLVSDSSLTMLTRPLQLTFDIAKQGISPQRMALDDQFIYWTDKTAIGRIGRP